MSKLLCVLFRTSIQYYVPIFNIQQHTVLRHKFTGAFLYVRHSFLLISDKFCDFSLRHCSGQCRDVGGGGQCGKKNLLHWALEARYDTAL